MKVYKDVRKIIIIINISVPTFEIPFQVQVGACERVNPLTHGELQCTGCPPRDSR